MSNAPYSDKQEILEVIEYNEDQDFHVALNENGERRRIDLHVDGADIPLREELIGHKVSIESSHAYIEIAHGVRLCEE